jgi:hypothetical protein
MVEITSILFGGERAGGSVAVCQGGRLYIHTGVASDFAGGTDR